MSTNILLLSASEMEMGKIFFGIWQKKLFQEKNSSRLQRIAHAKTLWQRNHRASEKPKSSKMNTERKRKRRLRE